MKKMASYLALFVMAFSIAGAAGYMGVALFTKSAPEIVLPDLVGKNIIDVLEILTHLGLNPKLHSTRFHDSIPKYGVCFQDPEPGATIKKGRDVILHISKGFKEIQMPDLRRLSMKEGLLRLEEQEIPVGRVVHVSEDTGLKGDIIAQYPLPFAKVTAGIRCDLLVSKGPAPVDRVMPDLEGLSLDEAVGRLQALSLDIGEVTSETDPLRDQGVVLAQTPHAGTRIPQSLKVDLSVNRPETGEVMDLENFSDLTLTTFQVPEGFANRHVRVTADLFGMDGQLYNGYMKPGKIINLLIPGGIKIKIRIFIDHELVLVKIIDPWRPELSPSMEDGHWRLNTGDFQWESSHHPSYRQTLSG